MTQFAHLHLHSQYSLLDGANRIDDVIAGAVEKGMPAIALTDHGNMFGAIEFYDKAKAAGIKPIIGIEAYVAQGSMRDRDPQRGRSNHLVLLAKNATGYRNLLRLTTKSYLEGFYYKRASTRSCCASRARTDRAVGVPQRRGERAGAGRLRGPGQRGLQGVPRHLRRGQLLPPSCRTTASPSSATPTRWCAAWRRATVPLVATNDCHYLKHGLVRARRAALHRHEDARRSRPAALPRPAVLLEERRGDAPGAAGRRRRDREQRAHRRGLQSRDPDRELPPARVPGAGRLHARLLPHQGRARGPRVRLDKLRRSPLAFGRHSPGSTPAASRPSSR